MKTAKYIIILVALVTGLSSCLVERERPGYRYHHPHHYYRHGYGY